MTEVDWALLVAEAMAVPACRRDEVFARWKHRSGCSALFFDFSLGRAVFRDLGDGISRELAHEDLDPAYLRALFLQAFMANRSRCFCYRPPTPRDRPWADDPRIIVDFGFLHGPRGGLRCWEFRWDESRQLQAHRLAEAPPEHVWPTPTCTLRLDYGTRRLDNANGSVWLDLAPRRWLSVGGKFVRTKPDHWQPAAGRCVPWEH